MVEKRRTNIKIQKSEGTGIQNLEKNQISITFQQRHSDSLKKNKNKKMKMIQLIEYFKVKTKTSFFFPKKLFQTTLLPFYISLMERRAAHLF